MSHTTADFQHPIHTTGTARPNIANAMGTRHAVAETFRLRPTVLAVALHGVLTGGLFIGAATLPQQAHAQASGANSAAATALPQGDAVKREPLTTP
jgi:hypothetical protein